MHLGELCNLSLGFTARDRLEPVATNGVLAVQLRDVQADEDVSSYALQRYAFENLAERYLIHGGEVLFRSRGAVNTAAVVGEELGEPAVALLPLMVIRANPDLVLPGYLAWAINQREGQRYLDSEAQGTNIRMIPKSVLERMDIPLPDLETQHRIISIHRLAKREGSLLRALADRREQFASIILAGHARGVNQEGRQ